MNTYSKPTRADVIRSLVYISLYLLVVSVSAFWLLPDWWLGWGLIVIAGLVWLVGWHTQNTAHRCPHCQHEFEISFWVDLISPHGFNQTAGWTLLNCPACKKWGKAELLKKNDPN